MANFKILRIKRKIFIKNYHKIENEKCNFYWFFQILWKPLRGSGSPPQASILCRRHWIIFGNFLEIRKSCSRTKEIGYISKFLKFSNLKMFKSFKFRLLPCPRGQECQRFYQSPHRGPDCSRLHSKSLIPRKIQQEV